MTNTKKIINSQVDDFSPSDFEGTLEELQDRIQDLIKQYGLKAKLSYDSDYYYQYDTSPTPRFFIQQEREETDKEYSDRIEKEEALRKKIEEKELAELKRLSEKYGKDI